MKLDKNILRSLHPFENPSEAAPVFERGIFTALPPRHPALCALRRHERALLRTPESYANLPWPMQPSGQKAPCALD